MARVGVKSPFSYAMVPSAYTNRNFMLDENNNTLRHEMVRYKDNSIACLKMTLFNEVFVMQMF
jgi:hypothetical protein